MNRQTALFIVYNSALHGLVLRTLEQHNAKGYTEWSEVYGRGSATGEPHLGSHAWPTTNGAMMVITDAERAERILSALHQIDLDNPQQGLRAFAWEVTNMI